MQPLRAFIPTVRLFIRIFRFQTYPMRLFNIMFILIYKSFGVIYPRSDRSGIPLQYFIEVLGLFVENLGLFNIPLGLFNCNGILINYNKSLNNLIGRINYPAVY